MRSLLVAVALASSAGAQNQLMQNQLILIADDLGVDRIAAYAEHPDPGRTPNIDALAERGILFRNAWACPVCSSSRAALLTGRYGFRTGIGTIILGHVPSDGLADEETTIAELLGPQFTRVAVGKWHLGGSNQPTTHPNTQGFRYFAGPRNNLQLGGGDYFRWIKTVNGQEAWVSTYQTTAVTDDAIRALALMPEPWLLLVAYSAPHTPVHAPPGHLHSFDLTGDPSASIPTHVKAMIEALDTEIGRLLEHVDENDTTIYFCGDNGTTGDATTAPFNPQRAKGSVYEGGVNVPLIVAGGSVRAPGSECEALVHLVDLYATVAELAGKVSAAEDSVSLVPYFTDPGQESLRSWVYTERFRPNGFGPYNLNRQAIRGQRYKLMRQVSGSVPLDEFYDLLADPFETTNLLPALTEEQQVAFDELEATMERLHSP